jgi:outer membrane usher protein
MHCLPKRQRLLHSLVVGGSGALLLASDSEAANGAVPVNEAFESSFMRQIDGYSEQAGALALSALGQGLDLAPGRYRVKVVVNHIALPSREVEIALDPASQHLSACVGPELIPELNLRQHLIRELDGLPGPCIDLAQAIDGAKAAFDVASMTLSISLPQAAVDRAAAGYVDASQWDQGVNAAFVNYQASARESRHQRSGQRSDQDLNLNTGLNLGPWRLRSQHSYQQHSGGDSRWTRAYSYAQRDLSGLAAQLTLGETSTDGTVFASVPIVGMQVASDFGMLPDSVQSYAPVVRGVANSRARVEVRQNGYPIYSTYVSPGPYQIDDLNITGGSGDLEVIVTEADGQERRFIQPYATLSNLLRNGVWRYSASLGRYNPNSGLDSPWVAQSTLARGMPWKATLYGGAMAAEYYQAFNLGLGRDLGEWGALGFDLTRADTDDGSGRDLSGYSYALRFGKSFETRTDLRFAGYRYSTEGYRDFHEAVRQHSHDGRWLGSRRSRLEASVFQSLSSSSVSLTLSEDRYWRTDYSRRQFQLAFNTQHQGVTYNLYASQSLSDETFGDRQIGLNISVPLKWGRGSSASLDLQERGGQYSQRATFNGYGASQRLNYQASLANSERGEQTAGLSMGYQGPVASVGAGLTQGPDYTSLSVNASGALLAHAGGLLAGPYLGETSGLIEVPGIAGIEAQNTQSGRTNADGYALLPYLRPYRVNRLALNTDTLGPEVEIDNATASVVPRRGAVVKQRFEARTVERVLLTLSDTQGRPLPFGAQLLDQDAQVLTIVGQAGQLLYSNTRTGTQRLALQWGAGERCEVEFDTASLPLNSGYRSAALTCR